MFVAELDAVFLPFFLQGQFRRIAEPLESRGFGRDDHLDRLPLATRVGFDRHQVLGFLAGHGDRELARITAGGGQGGFDPPDFRFPDKEFEDGHILESGYGHRPDLRSRRGGFFLGDGRLATTDAESGERQQKGGYENG